MNPIKIKVPFPKYEGMEVKSAKCDLDGMTLQYGKKEPKFKKGDIITGNSIHNGRWIFILKEDITTDYKYFALQGDKFGELYLDNSCYKLNVLFDFATHEEQQILFESLAKEGKKWNAEKLCIEDIEKDILVPESIRLYQPNKGRSDLFIGFGNNQMLGVYNGVYIVRVNDKDLPCKPVQCKLTPCKIEELKEGDTIYAIPGTCEDLSYLTNYYKVLTDDYYVHNDGYKNVIVEYITKFVDDIEFYKVEPIQ